MVINKIRTFIQKIGQINYDDLMFSVISDPAVYIRNLSYSKFGFIFDIETTTMFSTRRFHAMIDYHMPTYMNLVENGKIVYTSNASDVQLLLMILKDFS